MARRRAPGPPPPPIGVVEQHINMMERAVIYRTVDRDLFDVNDLLDWLVPAEALRHLRAAWPYTQNNEGQVAFDANVKVGDMDTQLHIVTKFVECLPPHDNLAEFQPTAKAPAIMAAMKEMQNIVREHDVLRRVVNWLNAEHVTPGFARHYFPALGSMLPAEHAFHKIEGTRFADRVMPYEIITDLRHAPEVIAKGLLCSPKEHGALDGTTYCAVQFDVKDELSRQAIPLFAKVR